jgi:KUP system potassium uptake protein
MTRLILHFGFMETPCVPDGVALALLHPDLKGIEPSAICYVVGRETLIPTSRAAGLPYWRKVIYAFMQRNSERSAVYFGVPAAQAFELGIEVEV